MENRYDGKAKPEELALRKKEYEITRPSVVNPSEKDWEKLQMETVQTDDLTIEFLIGLQQPNGTFDMNRNQQLNLSGQYRQAVSQLHRIFATLRNESAEYSDCLPTSFVDVEKELARCISGCLPDVPVEMRSIDQIQSLLRDYKVVRLLPDGTCSTSLHTVHVILQDNYKDSCFCQFLNLLLTGFMNTETKVIDL